MVKGVNNILDGNLSISYVETAEDDSGTTSYAVNRKFIFDIECRVDKGETVHQAIDRFFKHLTSTSQVLEETELAPKK